MAIVIILLMVSVGILTKEITIKACRMKKKLFGILLIGYD
jgi:hypothetical protein